MILMEMILSWVVDEGRFEDEDSSEVYVSVLEHLEGLWVGH